MEIEYFESVLPPQRMAALPHEDWVSSVSCQVPRYVFLIHFYPAKTATPLHRWIDVRLGSLFFRMARSLFVHEFLCFL